MELLLTLSLSTHLVTFSCPVATALPPPPTQPTSDSNKTPPTDGQISTSDASVGLIVGLAIAILVIIVLVIAMVTIAAVALKKHEKMKDLSSSRAVSNITYGTKGQSSIIMILLYSCLAIRDDAEVNIDAVRACHSVW